MAAIATDHIVARRTSLTGSIGVLFEFPEVSKLMNTLGVDVTEIKSAPLKAEPSPFRPPSEEAKAVIAGIVNDSFNWFVDIVAERRGLARRDALMLADGRMFSGRQALAAKLIDEIGGEEKAIAWLASAKGVDREAAGQGLGASEGGCPGPLFFRRCGRFVGRAKGWPVTRSHGAAASIDRAPARTPQT